MSEMDDFSTDLTRRIFADAIVIDSALKSHGHRPLSRTAFTLSNQKAAINSATQ